MKNKSIRHVVRVIGGSLIATSTISTFVMYCYNLYWYGTATGIILGVQDAMIIGAVILPAFIFNKKILSIGPIPFIYCAGVALSYYITTTLVAQMSLGYVAAAGAVAGALLSLTWAGLDIISNSQVANVFRNLGMVLIYAGSAAAGLVVAQLATESLCYTAGLALAPETACLAHIAFALPILVIGHMAWCTISPRLFS